jgi:protein phosphatase
VAVLSDVGRVRAANEDAFAVLPDQGLLIVSDGMGGHQAGATASKIVVDVLPAMIEQRLARARDQRSLAPSRVLRDTIVDLSRKVREQSAGRAGLAGMGATVVAVSLQGNRAYVAHMGDSRLYLHRMGRLQLLTHDHSLVALLLRREEITPAEARDHPARGKLSRYVGMETEVYPDVRALRLTPGDRLLLCTDGLTGMVSDEDVAAILKTAAEPESACRSLVDAANARGGRDNVTVLVADYTSA